MVITVQTAVEPSRSAAVDVAVPSEPPELRELAAELRVTVRALHPGIQDPSLRRFFTVEVPDAAEAQRVIARLLRSPAIAAAYVKPPEALP